MQSRMGIVIYLYDFIEENNLTLRALYNHFPFAVLSALCCGSGGGRGKLYAPLGESVTSQLNRPIGGRQFDTTTFD